MKIPDDFDAAAAKVAGQQSTDPVDVAARQLVDTQRTQAKSSLYNALMQNPDMAARAQKLGRQTGLPSDVVERNMPEVERNVVLGDMDRLLANSPTVAQWVADPKNAAVSHDDLGTMGAIESALRYVASGDKAPRGGLLADMGRAGMAGVSGLQRASAGVVGVAQAPFDLAAPLLDPLVGNILPGNPLRGTAQGFAGIRRGIEAQAKANMPKTEGIVESGVFSGFASLSTNLATLPLAFLPGGQGAALTGMVGPVVGGAYGEARGKGVAPIQALSFGVSQGAIEYATEVLPLAKLIGDLKVGAPLYKVLANQIAREVPGEQVATILQDLNEWAVLNPGKPFAGYIAERPSAAAQTLIATVVGVGGQVSVVKGIEAAVAMNEKRTVEQGGQEAVANGVVQTIMENALQMRLKGAQVEVAERDAQAITQLTELVRTSKLAQRDPVAFEAFVKQAALDGPVQDVYINAQTFAQAAQEAGITEQQLPEGVRTQLAEALATGGDLRIPIEEFASQIAPTKYAEALIDHMKVDPMGMSRAEAQVFMQTQVEQMQADVGKALAERDQDVQFKTSIDQVRTEFTEQLATANRFTPEVNASYANMLANFYAVTAAKVGMTPAELVKRYPLRVQAEGVSLDTTVATFDQGEVQVTDQVDEATGLPLNSDGTVTLFHHTSADKAQAIRESGALRSAGEPDVYLTTREQTDTGYGDTAVRVRIDPTKLQLYDEFDDGRQDFRVSVGQPAGALTDAKFNQGTGNRGQIAFGADITQVPSIITLLKGADLSTFLHESGHFFLEVQIDLASRIGAEANVFGSDTNTPGQRQILADTSALLDWFGVESINEWFGLSLEEKRSYHEKFARGFESYLFEGKAPSIELQGMFQRFRAWLLRVYKDLKALNVELTDEVRGVMDRMLATTEQIELAEKGRSMLPLFTAPEQAGMTTEEFAAYQELGTEATQDAIQDLQGRTLRDMQWMRNARGREIKRLQKESDARRAEVTMDARREIMAQPVYQAWQFLTGKRIDPDNFPGSRAPAQPKPEPVLAGIDGIPFVEGGKPFKTEAQARAAKALRPTTRVVKVDGGFALAEKSDAQLAAEIKAGKRLAAGGVGKAGEPLAAHEFIASRGGLVPSAKKEMSIEGNVRAGARWVFAAEGKGLTIEQATELLQESGYVEGDDHNTVLELIRRSIQDPQYAAGDWERIAEIELQAQIDEEMPGLGIDLIELGNGKLDLNALKGLPIAAEIVQIIENLKMTARDGIHPDLVAESFGFTSGDELVRTLAIAEAPKVAIEGLADQKMLEQYGDLASPQAIERAADAAIHNDTRARFVATELNALAKATGKPKVLASAAREYARAMIDRLLVRNVKPSQYAAAEVRAAKAAEKAMKAGDTAQAGAEKRNQLINTYATKSAHDALGEVEKSLRYLKKFNVEGTRKALDVDYLDQIDGILERFDLRTGASLKSIDKRKALAKWISEQEDLGIEVELPEKIAAEAFRQSYKDLSVEEFRGLVESVKQIEHLGRLKETLLTARDNRAFSEVIATMVASIEENSGDKKANNRTRDTLGNRAVNLFKGFLASHRKVASLARELDGFTDAGPVWTYLIRSMNESGDREATMRADATLRLTELLKPVLAEGRMGGKGQFFPSVAESLNRGEQLVMALNMGNEGNIQRLLDGRGWTLEQVVPVMQNLSAADWRFVQSVWDFFESYRPEIAAKERRVMGKEPTWVEPRQLEVATKDGEKLTLRGGYFPIVYDARESGRAEQQADAEAARQQMKGAFVAATTRRSFTKTRAEAVTGRPLVLTWDALFRGVNDVIHDLAWHEWVIDANRIVKNESLDRAVRSTYGADVVQQFKASIRDIAAGDAPNQDALSRVMTPLRTGAAVAGLGFNLMNAMLQPLGITQSMVRVGPRWVAQGIAEWAKSPVGLVREVHAKSEFMRNRGRTQQRELNEIQSVVQGKSEARAKLDALMFAPMQSLQLVADMPTWWGAYQKALTEAPVDLAADVTEDLAIKLADQAVLDSQSGGQVKDLALIQRGGPMQKLFTVFYGYFSAAYNLGVERTNATNFRSPLDIMHLAGDFLLLYSVPAVLASLMKSVLQPGGGDEDEEKLARKLIGEQISYMMGLVVGLRELTGAVQAATGTKQFDMAYGGPAGLRFFQELDKLGKQVGQGEMDRALLRSVVNVGGVALHLPSAQVNRTIDGVIAISEGKTDNPAALLFGVEK